MKHLTFLFFALVFAFAVNAQSATTTLDGTGSGVTGGIAGTAKLVSYSWAVQNPPAPVTFSAPTAVTTDATFTKAGTYNIVLTVTDDLGQTAAATLTVIVYEQQTPHAVIKGVTQIILKNK